MKMHWDKGKLELHWHFPDHGDPKIYYKLGAKLKDKLHVCILNALFTIAITFINFAAMIIV